jgi:RNA 3'-terminal phosphate cyclase (ATP)
MSAPLPQPGAAGLPAGWVDLDGSQGEGGGQILRTALSLSLRTGAPFRLRNVRHNRDKPGLRPQHLVAVQAAAGLGEAAVSGASVGSRELLFQPQRYGAGIRAATYRFDIGTAGSAPLVLQTVLPALLAAPAPSTVTIIGGTYNPKAPPYDFIERVYAPLLARLGVEVKVRMQRPGFYPAGGGQIHAEITPCPRPLHLDLRERGALLQRCATAVSARLPEHVSERELATLSTELGWPAECLMSRPIARSASPGNVVLIELVSEHITELFSSVGERGVPAEAVARQAAAEASAYLAAGVPVGEHLADQLLLPLALGHGGVYRTIEPSLHTRTQVEVIRRFLPAVAIHVTADGERSYLVQVSVPG